MALLPSDSIKTWKPRLSRLSFTILPRKVSSSTYNTFVLAMGLRQFDDESTANSWLAFHRDQSLVTVDHMRNITQPQPVSFCIMHISGWHAEKFFEYFILVFRGDPNSIVLHG